MKCNNIILSEEYGDFIGRYNGDISEALTGQVECTQVIDDSYFCAYYRLDMLPTINVANFTYNVIPKLYGLMDTTAVAATGSIRLQNQSGFNLTGRDVIIGFIDTGIDYTNKLFQKSTGQTRILSIWDQTDVKGNPPEGFSYGSEYTREEINRALQADNPLEVVPHRDENGHGTFMAGIACGSYDEQGDFIGAAPDSEIVMVKLKEAKKYLTNYFYAMGSQPLYQENDIMLAASFLKNVAIKQKKPIVIVVGLGCGNGGRAGGSPLDEVLNRIGSKIGNCVVVAAGNEGNERLHYRGTIGIATENTTHNVEFRVGDNVPGFVLELWGNAPDIFSVGFVSPFGESVPRIPVRQGSVENVNFVCEQSSIELTYELVESGTGGQLIFMRFKQPSPGIWTIKVYGNNILDGNFNIWGGLRQYTPEGNYFLTPNPDMTLTVPAATENVITFGGYDNVTNAFYPKSGRGFTRENRIKPDLTAPAVNVYGPGISGGYTRRTGTSVACALGAGACAQILQWGIVEDNEPYMKNNYIKNYLIRGAERNRDIRYPSEQWGYGTINVFDSFLILTRT